MKILFIGNYQSGPGGEAADETHITRELGDWGAEVTRVNRDEWREYVEEGYPDGKYKVPVDQAFDLAIICKWHHFYDGKFIEAIREKYNCPVFYWVWDYMPNPILPDWHVSMVKAANLYLGNDVMAKDYQDFKNCYYFNFDVVDKNIHLVETEQYLYDVTFLGSYLQQGDRIEYLTELNKHCKLKIFSINHEEWTKRGFDASPAVFGAEANHVIASSKINIGFSVEANCWGYWSNRVGRILRAGGLLLYQYAPGMEQFLDGVSYFSSIDEMIERVGLLLRYENARENLKEEGLSAGQKMTSKRKTDQLLLIADRFLAGGIK